jgi:ABC-2 type transport system ATP-binding protein
MASLYGMLNNTIKEKIEYYSKLFGIFEKINLRLNKMSSGQRKKIMVIQSLMVDTDLYISDEPTENLDPDNRFIFFNELKKIRDAGKSVFICTHNLREIEPYVDDVVIIEGGKVVFSGLINKKYNLSSIYHEYKETRNLNKFKDQDYTDKITNNPKALKYKKLFNAKKINKDEYLLLINNLK